MPFSSIGDPDEPAVDPDSFRPDGDQYPGGWKEFPTPWEGDPEERLLAGEARALILDAIEQLPSNQRAVTNQQTNADLECQTQGTSARALCSHRRHAADRERRHVPEVFRRELRLPRQEPGQYVAIAS